MKRMFSGVTEELKNEIIWSRTQRMFGIKGPNA
jgi:hypothetical protein